MSCPKRILVVGAGCSGLTAIKACLEEDLVPVCLEKTLDIGGLWRYSDQPAAPNTASIYRSLVINTCKEMMAFSDFPVPDDIPQFLTHDNVLLYFRLYAQNFNLLPYIRFNTEVRHIRQADNYSESGRWRVTYVRHARDECMTKCCSTQSLHFDDDVGNPSINDVGIADPNKQTVCEIQAKNANNRCVLNYPHPQTNPEQQSTFLLNDARTPAEPEVTQSTEMTQDDDCQVVTEEYEAVMVCTGHHTVPYVPSIPGAEEFQGQRLHSHDYKFPEPFKDKRVLVVGIGNSAVDVAADLAKTAKKVYLSTRRGSWIVPRTALWGVPADMLGNSRVVNYLPSKLLEWSVEKMANLRMNHEKLGLKPQHGSLGAHPTINDELPFHLLNGRVEVRNDVARVRERSVLFQDGSLEEVDVIIMATGYDYRLDFVDRKVISVVDNRVHLYKYMIPPELAHPTLAIIGLVQAIGAVMPISEIQSRWFVNLLQGHVKLPSLEVMQADIDKKQLAMDSIYYKSRRHTVQTYWIEYMDEVAIKIGVRPNFWELLLKDLHLALKCFFGPCLPAQYRLQGPHPWPQASHFIKDTIQRFGNRRQYVQRVNTETAVKVKCTDGAEFGGLTRRGASRNGAGNSSAEKCQDPDKLSPLPKPCPQNPSTSSLSKPTMRRRFDFTVFVLLLLLILLLLYLCRFFSV